MILEAIFGFLLVYGAFSFVWDTVFVIYKARRR